ncbi:hypothetical protein EVAR_5695_1 [Eumeta japonica]|uniref:Uncharacterized protein n=1 Tax=Eumeta variegata TaxID=151549 RepID=A0A4C1T866_EUMVA|nr:hypothetical protein EVAR_5695_1 [Eumeta japonica]
MRTVFLAAAHDSSKWAARPVQFHTLAEHRREITVFVVVFRLGLELKPLTLARCELEAVDNRRDRCRDKVRDRQLNMLSELYYNARDSAAVNNNNAQERFKLNVGLVSELRAGPIRRQTRAWAALLYLNTIIQGCSNPTSSDIITLTGSRAAANYAACEDN